MRSNTTSFLPRALIDQKGQAHCFEQADDLFLLDGMPLTAIEQTDQQMMCLKTATTNVVMTPSALGVAFAGADPTLADIGVLFGTYLHLCIQRHHLTRLLHTFSEEIDTARASLEHAIPLAVPPYHFDAFTERALRRFDGTEGAAHLIADILAQPLDVVRSWATFVQQRSGAQRESEDALTQKQPEAEQPSEDLGTPHILAASSGVLSPQENQEGERVSLGEAEQQALPVEDDAGVPPNQEEIGDGSHSSSDLEGPTTGELSTLHLSRIWNRERLEQLERALLMCGASTLKEAMEQVAPSFECTLGAIQGQVYSNGMNIRFKEKQKTRLSSMIEKQTVSPSDEQQKTIDLPHVFDLHEETPRCLESSEEGSARGTESDGLTQSPISASEAFIWDDGKIQQLRTAFMESQASTSDAIQEIVARFDWPLASVRSKIYYLRLPESKKKQQHVTSPLVVATQDLRENELKYGNYRWRIVIGTKIDQWNLQYRYGEFPEQFRGQEVVFDNQRYRVDKFYNQDVYLSPLVQQATTPSEISSPIEFAVPAS